MTNAAEWILAGQLIERLPPGDFLAISLENTGYVAALGSFVDGSRDNEVTDRTPSRAIIRCLAKANG